MVTTVQMIVIVVIVMGAGAVCSILLHIFNTHKKNRLQILNFTDNNISGKMVNSDIRVDDIIQKFKLLY